MIIYNAPRICWVSAIWSQYVVMGDVGVILTAASEPPPLQPCFHRDSWIAMLCLGKDCVYTQHLLGHCQLSLTTELFHDAVSEKHGGQKPVLNC